MILDTDDLNLLHDALRIAAASSKSEAAKMKKQGRNLAEHYHNNIAGSFHELAERVAQAIIDDNSATQR